MKNILKISFLFLQVAVIVAFVIYLNTFLSYRLIIRIFAFIFCLNILLKQIIPSYKILYILFIAFFPSLGIFTYLINLKKFRKKAYKNNLKDIKKYGKTAAYIKGTFYSETYCPENIKYYSNGSEYFSALFYFIERAEKYVLLQYFIVKECGLQQKLFELLKRKAQVGVKIYFLYDALGSITFDNKIKKFAKAYGITAKSFNSIGWFINGKINNRHHGKITVIDGKIGFLGGVNIGDEYVNEIKKFGVWKDGGISFCGLAVNGLIKEFNRNFGKNVVKFTNVSTKNKKFNGKSYMNVFSSRPTFAANDMAEIYLTALYNAKEKIVACTPYLILDDNVKNALVSAVKRGVSVKIIIPEIPDKKAVYLVTKSYAEELLHFGVKVYTYSKGFIHSKNTIVDGKYVITGSGNLDYRSMYLHYETAAFIKNAEICEIIEKDITQNLKKYKGDNRFIFKITSNFLKIFAPLM